MKKWLIGIFGILSVLFLAGGIATKLMNGRVAASVSVIGGADGPTSIFLAGKVGNSSFVGLIAAGIVSGLIAIILLLLKKQ